MSDKHIYDRFSEFYESFVPRPPKRACRAWFDTQPELQGAAHWEAQAVDIARVNLEIRSSLEAAQARIAELECAVTLANDRTESERVAELERELADERLAYSSLMQHHGAADIDYREERTRREKVEAALRAIIDAAKGPYTTPNRPAEHFVAVDSWLVSAARAALAREGNSDG